MRSQIIAVKILLMLASARSTPEVLERKSTVPVAGFQLDGQAVQDSYLLLRDEYALDIAQSFSVCFWFQLHYVNGARQACSALISSTWESSSTNKFFITLDTSENLEYHLRATHNIDECKQIFQCKINVTGQLELMKWHHVCVIFDWHEANASLTLAFDRSLRHTVSSTVSWSHSYSARPLALYIGQEQDAYKDIEDFDLIQSFSGQVAELGFWKGALNSSTVDALTTCQSHTSAAEEESQLLFGPLNGTDFIQSNVSWSYVELSDFCDADPIRGQLLWLRPTSFLKFEPLCRRVQGTLPSADNASALAGLVEEKKAVFSRIADPRLPERERMEVAIITGVKWDRSESYVNRYTGHQLAQLKVFDPHKIQQTSGVEGVVLFWMYKYKLEFFDTVLGKGLCQLGERREFLLRGLCDQILVEGGNGVIDHQYYLYGTNYGLPKFRSEIIYSGGDQDAWILRSTHSSRFFQLQGSTQLLPLGRKSWKSHGNICGDGVERNLTLTLCRDHEYTCDSGECIPLSDRCNGRLNCGDMSDEDDCSYIRFGVTYNKFVAPVGHDHDTVNVDVKFIIQDIPFIDTFNLKFTVNYFIEMSWRDSRLEFVNLNDRDVSNQLSTGDREFIWSPKLVFMNSLGATTTHIDQMATTYIKKAGAPKLASLEEAKEAYIFSGADNKIFTIREYYDEFSCDYKLCYYPFDTQVCKMEFEASARSGDAIHLHRAKGEVVKFLSSLEKVEFEIRHITTEFGIRSEHNISQANVIVVFRRRMEYHVSNTMFQTFVLKAIGLLTLFFDVHNFTDRIMVTLTTMLVIATVSTSIQETLPKTSFYKLMDIWLMFCFNLLIFTMIIHTIISRILSKTNGTAQVIPKRMLGKRGQPESNECVAQKVNRTGQVLFVMISLVFHSIFWSIAICEYSKTIEDHMAERKGSYY